MAGVEAERVGAAATEVGLLAYVQESSRAAWAGHAAEHELEDKALALAVARVEQSQQALRELLEADVKALREALSIEHGELDRRSEERDRAAREVAEVRTQGAERWLKDVMDQRSAAHDAAHEAYRVAEVEKAEAWKVSHLREHTLIQLAVDKAADAMAGRLEGMNEFRAQLDRQAATLVTLDVLDVRLAAIGQRLDKADDVVEKRLGALEQSLGRGEGRAAGQAAFWAYIVGAAGVATAAIVLIRDLIVH